MAHTLGIEHGGILATEPPGHILALVKVKATHPRAITVVIGVVVHVARERAQEGVKAPASGQALLPVEAQVPLAHHVGRITGLLELLGQRHLVQGQAVGLPRADDGVLKSCVDLVPGHKSGGHRRHEVSYKPLPWPPNPQYSP